MIRTESALEIKTKYVRDCPLPGSRDKSDWLLKETRFSLLVVPRRRLSNEPETYLDIDGVNLVAKRGRFLFGATLLARVD